MNTIQKLIPSLMLTLLLGSVQAADVSTPQEAAHVLNRLGYGPRPGDIERVSQSGVDRYIEQQLNPQSLIIPDTLQQKLTTLHVADLSAGDALNRYHKILKNTQDESEDAKKNRREMIGLIFQETAEKRVWRAIESPRQLEEVMVEFWFNHFNVFNGKGLDRALIASYERDAIRPFVFGNFRDLLGATAKHPAMLFYLDNWLSTSADFRPRTRRGKPEQQAKANGLNENYARELMELHTLGVDGGYSQHDVTELARILTGWTFDPRIAGDGHANFIFDPERHDNGIKQWLGKTVSPNGKSEGEFALDILALHPATAHHISYQLAQFFVQDQPPEALVKKLSQRFLETRGDIRLVLKTLFSSPEFRDPKNFGVKYKTPYQFVISAIRASDLEVKNVRPLLGSMSQLGMPLYGSQTPDGYKNTEQAWLNPDALSRRINFSTALATGHLPLNQSVDAGDKMGARQIVKQADNNDRHVVMDTLNVNQLLGTLGPLISENTRTLINGSPESLRASLILGSPDFMQH
ncbi:DUF1800 domain-containing protein [Undibacterium jejuense]|uniref:DUF1800 domain-containing protein n=1 Tax=Undibacterium jejuense TaxID=1344949 RepID=A0A923HEQ8_9BURK|nr:DUF1800 domain-containing protein [Undibacterium jejuense]MBC3862681.1 DUF1800 domain-containing protein [Undibacterium jejuense]